MHKISRTVLPLGLLVLFPAGVLAERIPGTTAPVETLAADLEWAFVVERTAEPQGTSASRKEVWRFRSRGPYSVTDGERLFLRFSLSVYRYETEEAVIQQFEAWALQGESAMGLTYAWTRIFRRGDPLYRLDIPCTFSKANVQKITAALTRSITEDVHGPLAALYCVCGGSCMTGD
jgi:hypothetical protein